MHVPSPVPTESPVILSVLTLLMSLSRVVDVHLSAKGRTALRLKVLGMLVVSKGLVQVSLPTVWPSEFLY